MIDKIIDFFCCLKYNKVEHSFNYRGGVYMLNALHVANSLLDRAMVANISMSPMKLQKLLYFVYRRYLIQTGDALFNERFSAWKYGPVQENVYNEFRGFGANPIDRFYREADGKILIVNEENDDVREALDFVWSTYSRFGGIYLSELTHRKNTAWRHAVDNDEDYLEDRFIRVEVEEV